MHTDVACLICYLCYSLKDCCKSCGGVPNFSFHPALKNRPGRHGRLRVTHFQRLNHLKVGQPDGYPLQLGLILFQSPSSKCSQVSSKLPEKVYSSEAAHTFLMYSGKKSTFHVDKVQLRHSKKTFTQQRLVLYSLMISQIRYSELLPSSVNMPTLQIILSRKGSS